MSTNQSVITETPAWDLEVAQLRLQRAQLRAQIGSDEDFEEIVTAQVSMLRAARAENQRRLSDLEEKIASLINST